MENKTIPINDLKLSSFLRLMSPQSFVGIEREINGRVAFIFEDNQAVRDLSSQYLRGMKFTLSPQELGNKIDEAKRMIFSNV